MSEWQPIETAPLNEVIWGYCFEDYQQPITHTHTDIDDEETIYICKSVIKDRFVSVTHWKPLPEPPKETP